MVVYTNEQIARVCHEAHRGLQYVQGDPCPSAPWDAESSDLRMSVLAGVRSARQGRTPRELHDEWVRGRENAGWRWGPVKDQQQRTHPAMIPYDDLSARRRLQDALFLAVVTTMVIGTP
jgi:hypothetical protein